MKPIPTCLSLSLSLYTKSHPTSRPAVSLTLCLPRYIPQSLPSSRSTPPNPRSRAQVTRRDIRCSSNRSSRRLWSCSPHSLRCHIWSNPILTRQTTNVITTAPGGRLQSGPKHRNNFSGQFSNENGTISSASTEAFYYAQLAIFFYQHCTVRVHFTDSLENPQQVESDDSFSVLCQAINDAFEKGRRLCETDCDGSGDTRHFEEEIEEVLKWDSFRGDEAIENAANRLWFDEDVFYPCSFVLEPIYVRMSGARA